MHRVGGVRLVGGRRLFLLAISVALAMALVPHPVQAKDRQAEPRRPSAGPMMEKDAEKRTTAPGRLPRTLLVQFRAGASRSLRAGVHRSVGARVLRRLPVGQDVYLVSAPIEADVRAIVRRYLGRSAVQWAEPNMPRVFQQVVPNDQHFVQQWGLENTAQAHAVADPPPDTTVGIADADIDATDAWALTTGSAETVIAVIDSGADLSNPDLVSNLWSNPAEVPANGLDDDQNGYVDDSMGWDFVQNDNTPQDTHGHGTHVAGIIAAAMNDGVGVAGVCPECRLMILRYRSNLSSELEAVAYAIDNGADIINFSSVSDTWSVFERAAYEAATDAGILSVVAAGNENGNNDMAMGDSSGSGLRDAPLYPASYGLPAIVSVAASNDYDQYAYATGCYYQHGENAAPCRFTNLGHDSVDLAAPGVDVVSTALGGLFAVADGTSMAAPHVAGIAGLVRSIHPEYSVLQLRNAVVNSVDHPADLAGGWTFTSGRANAIRALTAAPGVPTSVSSVARARSISGTVRGRLSFPRNVNDVFKARLRRGATYRAFLNVPTGKDFDLWVWKPGTVDIWQVEATCNWIGPCRWLQRSSTRGKGKDETIVFKARRSGVYYFQLSSWFSRGRYRLALSRL